MKGKYTRTKEIREKMGKAHRGYIWSEESRKKLSNTMKGRPATKGRTGMPHTIETRLKMSAWQKGIKRPNWVGELNPAKRPEVRKKISESKKGSKNPNWKGGVSPINVLIRQSAEYNEWRNNVLKRDNWTCQICGLKGGKWIKEEKRKVFVHVDHIKQFALYPELRFELSNGRTLCRECHKKTETYGFHK